MTGYLESEVGMVGLRGQALPDERIPLTSQRQSIRAWGPCTFGDWGLMMVDLPNCLAMTLFAPQKEEG